MKRYRVIYCGSDIFSGQRFSQFVPSLRFAQDLSAFIFLFKNFCIIKTRTAESRWLWLLRSSPRLYIAELPRVNLWQELISIFLKKEKNRCNALESFKTPNKIQPKEYSKGSGSEGVLHINLGRERQLELRQPLLERVCQLGRQSE